MLTFHDIFIQECILYFLKNEQIEQIMPQSNYCTRNNDYYPQHILTFTEKYNFINV